MNNIIDMFDVFFKQSIKHYNPKKSDYHNLIPCIKLLRKGGKIIEAVYIINEEDISDGFRVTVCFNQQNYKFVLTPSEKKLLIKYLKHGGKNVESKRVL